MKGYSSHGSNAKMQYGTGTTHGTGKKTSIPPVKHTKLGGSTTKIAKSTSITPA